MHLLGETEHWVGRDESEEKAGRKERRGGVERREGRGREKGRDEGKGREERKRGMEEGIGEESTTGMGVGKQFILILSGLLWYSNSISKQ